MNGDIWPTINEIRGDVRAIAVDGCAHKETHTKYIESLQSDLKFERKERQEMGERLVEEMRSMRNQILAGVVIVMSLALVIDKVLK